LIKAGLLGEPDKKWGKGPQDSIDILKAGTGTEKYVHRKTEKEGMLERVESNSQYSFTDARIILE